MLLLYPPFMDTAAVPHDPDAAILAAANSTGADLEAPFDLTGLAARTGATTVLLEAISRAGLLRPHHVDDGGIARYSEADVAAVAAGLDLLDAGLPLAELLDLARRTDEAVSLIADQAVDAFLRYVRDPILGVSGDTDEAAALLIAASMRMLPSTERIVAHHLRRRIVAEAIARMQASQQSGNGT